MDTAKIAQEMASLPPEAQRQIVDFLAFLKTRYLAPSHTVNAGCQTLQDDPFVGMWQDREEMQDSSAWVQQQRQWESAR